MKVIGLTGGVGSGKSTILAQLREQGCYTVELDKVARELMMPGQTCYNQVVKHFGDDILLDNSLEIDRKKLSGLVFQDKEKLEQLNRIVHPMVKQWIIEKIQEKKNQKDCNYFVIEAALLIEDHYDTICDELWYVYADKETRIKRLMETRGYSREKALSIMSSQLSDDEYKKHCERVIDNSDELCYTDLRFL